MNWVREVPPHAQETAQIQRRLVIFALVAVLVTGLAVGLATAIPAYQSAKEAAENAADYQVRLQAMALRQYLTRLDDVAMQVTSRSAIREKLELYHQRQITLAELQEFTADKLADALRQHQDAVGITRLDRDGELLVQVGTAAPIYPPLRVAMPTPLLPPEETRTEASGKQSLQQTAEGRGESAELTAQANAPPAAPAFPPALTGPQGATSSAPIPPPCARAPLLAPMAMGEESLLVVGAPISDGNGERIGTDLVVFRVDGLVAILRGVDEMRNSRAFFAARGGQIWSNDKVRSLRAQRPSPLLNSAIDRAFAGEHGLVPDAGKQVALFAPVTAEWAIVATMPAASLYAPALQEVALPVVAVLVMLALAAFGTSRLMRPLAQRGVHLSTQLYKAAEEQRSLLEYARGFLYRTDDQGRIAFISPSVREVLGFAPDELPVAVALHLADVAPRHAQPDVELPPKLLRVRNEAGGEVVLEVNARVNCEADGRGVFGVARDVTQRVLAEEAQRAGEERLRTLIDAAPDVIYFKDGAGCWQEVNAAGLALFGFDADHYRGLTDEQLAERLPAEMGTVLRKLADAEAFAWEARSIVRSEETVAVSGGERALDLIRIPLFDAVGRRTGLVVLGRDVTERLRAERELARTNAEWTYAMDFLEDAIFLVDLEQRIMRANGAFYALVNRLPEQVIGQHIRQVLFANQSGNCRVCTALINQHDDLVTMEPEDSDNPTGRPIEVTVKVVPDADGTPARMLLGIRDLTRLRRTEEELRLAASVFQGSQEGIVITDPQRRVLRVNEAFSRVMGFTADEVAGRSMPELLWARKSEESRHQHIWDEVEAHGLWHGEAWYRRKTGEMFPAWHRISALRDHDGAVRQYINTFTDITDKKLSEERIHHLAHYDVLTDLPNRLLFNDRFNHSMERAQRNGEKLALLFLDLDRFKNVNDTLGHHVGDDLLRIIGERLRASVREEDTVARLGGDEFAVVLEEMARVQDAGIVASKIMEAIAKPATVEGQELFMGASIGISVFPDDGSDVQTLLRNADAAMYRAKEQGRNTYEFYTPELTTASVERMDLENSLRRALERGELLLHFQPQVLAADGRIIGAEALLRWAHPTKGMVPPNVFVPLAEDSGLMGHIGEWVIDSACEQLRAWQDAGFGIRRMAVNLSGQQIIRGDLVETVSAILQRRGVNATDLELEITESFVMSHLTDGVDVLNGLKELGVTLAIDDFGTGYSSLAYLKRLPIDRLKIDRSFVRDIPSDRDDMAIAATIIAMAHSLELQVIAEGVEEPAQMAFLRSLRCDEVQGYLYGKPMPAAEFAALLAKNQGAEPVSG